MAFFILPMERNRLKKLGLLTTAILLLVLFSVKVYAEEEQTAEEESKNEERFDNIEEEIGEKEDDLEKIEKKIRTYEKVLDVKRSQTATLENQIDIIDTQIGSLGEEVKRLEGKIDLTDLEIKDLGLKIDEKNELIRHKQAALRALINDLYRNDKRSLIEILLVYPQLSTFFQEAAYTQQANDKVLFRLGEINNLKKELKEKRDTKEEKFEKMTSLREEKLQKKFYLTGEQNSKERLLERTQGEEEKYQEMLSRVEGQKQMLLGDIEDLAGAHSGELAAAKSGQKKPKTGLASAGWYYSQQDPRWKNDNIGMSRTKMGNYGCAVSSVAMVLKYHGVNINPGTLAKQPIFYNDLIVWPAQWQHVKRSGSFSHGNIDWDRVDKELKDRNPVIVFVRANGRGAGHYVVVHHKDKKGKYVVHDPIWGSNIFLTSTKENISILYGSGTSIDQMIIYHSLKRKSKD